MGAALFPTKIPERPGPARAGTRSSTAADPPMPGHEKLAELTRYSGLGLQFAASFASLQTAVTASK